MRWRGFNLLAMFQRPEDHRWPDMLTWDPAGFRELDFAWMADWGFDCARLPLDHRIWTDPADPFRIDERPLVKIDRALDHGRRRGVHVMLNLHTAPGWGVCEAPVPGFELWRDRAAEDAFVFQWELLARRWRGVAADRLSFNPVNEPWGDRAGHERVMRRMIAAVRAIDPARPIVVDGFDGGAKPVTELDDLGVLHACRGYWPTEISHHRAWWLRAPDVPMAWPIHLDSWGHLVDRAALLKLYEDQGFAAIARAGKPVFCGEFGAYRMTPHAVTVAWTRDLLSVFRELGIGFALWNFRGAVGILDSQREDVAYEDWYGHRLDRELLEALRAA